MLKDKEQNRIHSDYDALIHSSDYEDLESDIAYFSASKKDSPKREVQSTARSAAARKKEPVKTQKRRGTAVKKSNQKAIKKATVRRSAEVQPKPREHKKAKNDNFNVLIAGFLVCFIIILAALLTLATSDKQYSENENRYLAQRPRLSLSSLSDGSYMKDMESYLSDQFAARSSFVKARTVTDIFFGKKEIGNVYIGKNHFLFEKPEAWDDARMEKTLTAINAFSQKHKKINSFMAIIPDSSEILADYMPKNAPTQNQTEQIKKVYQELKSNVKTIDVCSTLKKSDNLTALYYRTDHHWTTAAAEIAFRQIAANMKLDTGKVTYDTYALTNDFQGTLASSSGLFNAKDSIYITVPQTKVKYAVHFTKENTNSASMFVSEKLKQKNKYEVFFGGNFAEVKIDTTLNSKKVLMVVKDSYANCLVPMLMPYYKSIIMIDPRYYNDKIEQVIKDESVTDILWLYNANTFLADTSIQNVFQ